MFLHQKIIIFLTILITTTTVVMFAPLFVLGATNGPGNMTVDDCVSRTRQTKEQCSEMVNKFKNMTDDERTKMTSPQGGQMKIPGGSTSNENPSISKEGSKSDSSIANNDGLIEKASRMKAEKESQFKQIEKRIAKIIEFLNSKNKDLLKTVKGENKELLSDLKDFNAPITSREDASNSLKGIDVLVNSAQEINLSN